jgi:hypothetical protein
VASMRRKKRVNRSGGAFVTVIIFPPRLSTI